MTEAVAVKVERRADAVHVSGTLTIASARDALAAAAATLDLARDGSPLVFDLAGIETCDSAALAVLLEWQRNAAARGSSVVYRHVPERLLQLARISELEPVLAVEGQP